MPLPVRWDFLFAAGSAHFILPFAYPCLVSKGLTGLVPEDVLQALEAINTLARQRNERCEGQIKRISGALNRIGIEPLWLKGAAWIIGGIPWARQRMMIDVDFWVPHDALNDVVEVLRAGGYLPYAGKEDRLHHIAALFHPGEPASVEVHHLIVLPKLSRILSNESVPARARSVRWKGTSVRVPAIDDQIVHVATQGTDTQFLSGLLPASRPLDLACQCKDYGVDASLALMRTAYGDAGELATIEEYLHLTGALFAVPGAFSSSGVPLREIERRIRFPRWHACRVGYRDLRRYCAASGMSRPLELLAKLVRRSWRALRLGERW